MIARSTFSSFSEPRMAARRFRLPPKEERRMKTKTRRRIETGRRALSFSLAHPDPSPGYATTLTSLQELLGRADQLIILQRDRTSESRGATVQKRNLRRRIRRSQMKH